MRSIASWISRRFVAVVDAIDVIHLEIARRGALGDIERIGLAGNLQCFPRVCAPAERGKFPLQCKAVLHGFLRGHRIFLLRAGRCLPALPMKSIYYWISFQTRRFFRDAEGFRNHRV